MTNETIGWQTLQRVLRLDQNLKTIGMRLGNSRFAYDHDRFAVLPYRDDGANGVPVYSNDASIFNGDLQQVEAWVCGISWARDYDRMIKLSTKERRDRKEQDMRNQRLMTVLQQENKEETDK